MLTAGVGLPWAPAQGCCTEPLLLLCPGLPRENRPQRQHCEYSTLLPGGGEAVTDTVLDRAGTHLCGGLAPTSTRSFLHQYSPVSWSSSWWKEG